jgi:hypothetical protein
MSVERRQLTFRASVCVHLQKSLLAVIPWIDKLKENLTGNHASYCSHSFAILRYSAPTLSLFGGPDGAKAFHLFAGY